MEGARVGGYRHHAGKRVAQALVVKHYACPGPVGAVHRYYERCQAASRVEMAVHEVVPSDGGLQMPNVHSLGRTGTLEGADYRPLGHFDDALADGVRIGGGQGGNGSVTPGKRGILRGPRGLFPAQVGVAQLKAS